MTSKFITEVQSFCEVHAMVGCSFSRQCTCLRALLGPRFFQVKVNWEKNRFLTKMMMQDTQHFFLRDWQQKSNPQPIMNGSESTNVSDLVKFKMTFPWLPFGQPLRIFSKILYQLMWISWLPSKQHPQMKVTESRRFTKKFGEHHFGVSEKREISTPFKWANFFGTSGLSWLRFRSAHGRAGTLQL